MARSDTLLYSIDTEHGHYEVVEMEYEGRPSRILFSGDKIAAQSGLALDDNPDLLFDYNQRFKELVDSLQPKHLLLIGGAVLTLPTALLAAFPELQIDVVEPDKELENIAERFFNFKPSPRIQIFHDDGRHFLENTKNKYDLILIDAFTHTVIPSSLTSHAAIELFSSHLNRNGVVGINIISAYYGRGAQEIIQQYERYNDVFKVVEVFPASRSLVSFWLPQNFVLVAYSGKKKEVTIRYEALDPPKEST